MAVPRKGDIDRVQKVLSRDPMKELIIIPITT
jgi:hypothetical protein